MIGRLKGERVLMAGGSRQAGNVQARIDGCLRGAGRLTPAARRTYPVRVGGHVALHPAETAGIVHLDRL